ncbi:MAG: ABC transporter substrate-binding protein [Burkholderiales bacterium]
MKFLSHAVAVLAASLASAGATAQEKFTYLTNWYAQAEHGGFYHGLASGSYKKAGLDVTIRMGGPQVNGMQLLAAGQADCFMGYDTQTMRTREQGINAVTVAAAFQKDPQVIIAHPDVKKIEELKTRTILISSAAHQTYWPWMKATWGFTDAQMRPYTFNVQPFLADKNIAQQGYLSSEPYSIETEGKIKPTVFLLADLGWPPYSTTIVCMEKTVTERKGAVAAFVRASMEGWRDYLKNPAAANALIKRDNPNMSDDKLANGVAKMKEMGIVTSGDAAKFGIGVITDERMKRTYDMMVANKVLDPKIDYKKTFTTEFIKDLRIMP